MTDDNTVEISDLGLYLQVKPKIPFNMKNDSLVSYLNSLREFDKKSKPSDIIRLAIITFGVLMFGAFSVFFFAEAVSQIMKVFQNSFIISERDYLLALGIPRLFVAPVSIFAFLLAGSIMLLATVFNILSYLFGAHKNWTIYHRQLLTLVENLQEKEILEEYFVLQEEKKSFQMVKCSIEWEMEWMFPFLFQNFP
ncbi:MAG: hypothetical protein ACFFDC_13085, partial [Promethearchaeota archaeon]